MSELEQIRRDTNPTPARMRRRLLTAQRVERSSPMAPARTQRASRTVEQGQADRLRCQLHLVGLCGEGGCQALRATLLPALRRRAVRDGQ